jgi:hypothetical protein
MKDPRFYSIEGREYATYDLANVHLKADTARRVFWIRLWKLARMVEYVLAGLGAGVIFLAAAWELIKW